MERFHRVVNSTVTGYLLSSIILLLSLASLPPLRVTLTHFLCFLASGAFVFQSISSHTWRDLARNLDSLGPPSPDSPLFFLD